MIAKTVFVEQCPPTVEAGRHECGQDLSNGTPEEKKVLLAKKDCPVSIWALRNGQ